jgi:hypothetical protein
VAARNMKHTKIKYFSLFFVFWRKKVLIEFKEAFFDGSGCFIMHMLIKHPSTGSRASSSFEFRLHKADAVCFTFTMQISKKVGIVKHLEIEG